MVKVLTLVKVILLLASGIALLLVVHICYEV